MKDKTTITVTSTAALEEGQTYHIAGPCYSWWYLLCAWIRRIPINRGEAFTVTNIVDSTTAEIKKPT